VRLDLENIRISEPAGDAWRRRLWLTISHSSMGESADRLKITKRCGIAGLVNATAPIDAMGKSQVTAGTAAVITTGGTWPWIESDARLVMCSS
jgi:hypothetical protein